jgi:hypothetical protein
MCIVNAAYSMSGPGDGAVSIWAGVRARPGRRNPKLSLDSPPLSSPSRVPGPLHPHDTTTYPAPWPRRGEGGGRRSPVRGCIAWGKEGLEGFVEGRGGGVGACLCSTRGGNAWASSQQCASAKRLRQHRNKRSTIAANLAAASRLEEEDVGLAGCKRPSARRSAAITAAGNVAHRTAGPSRPPAHARTRKEEARHSRRRPPRRQQPPVRARPRLRAGRALGRRRAAAPQREEDAAGVGASPVVAGAARAGAHCPRLACCQAAAFFRHSMVACRTTL